MNRQFTVEELEQYRLWWSRLIEDVSRISAEPDDARPLDDSDVMIVKGTVLDSAAVSGDGESRSFMRQFSRRVQRRDRPASDIAEFVPFTKSGEPVTVIAPTALDASVVTLEKLAWEFLDCDAEGARQNLSLIEFDWLQVQRMECRMEREVSLLLAAEDVAGGAQDDEADGRSEPNWSVSREEFILLTMKNGKRGASWQSVYNLSKEIRERHGDKALPRRETRLPYAVAAEVWNRGMKSTNPVPSTVAEAKSLLEVAKTQGWKVAPRPKARRRS